MSEETAPERATTLLVYRTVDDMAKRMDAHFDGVKQRLDRIEPVEGRVDEHDKLLVNHEVRIINLEQADSTRGTWWRVSLPPLLIASLALIATVVIALLT